MGAAGSVRNQINDLPPMEINVVDDEQSSSFHEINTFAVSGKLMRSSFSSSRISRQDTLLGSSSVDSAITKHACLLDYYFADSGKGVGDESMFPTLFKAIYLKQRAIAMNSKARALFLRYFASGCWIKSLTADNSSVPSRPPTSLDLVAVELFDSLIMAVALKSFGNSDVYRYMIEENWKTDLDLITFVTSSPVAGQGRRSFLRSLIGDDIAPSSTPLVFRLQTRLLLLTTDFIEQTVSNTAWLFDLQKMIDDLPVGVSVHCTRPAVSLPLAGGGQLIPFSRNYRNTFAKNSLPLTDYSDTLSTKWTQAVKRGEIVRATVLSVDKNEQLDVLLYPVQLPDGRCRGALVLWTFSEKQQLGSEVFDLGCLLSKLCV